jgi:Restriction alleviation protein Lar
MTEALPQISPCPFCGGTGMAWAIPSQSFSAGPPSRDRYIPCDGESTYFVSCAECGAQGQVCLSKMKAVVRWNHRV